MFTYTESLVYFKVFQSFVLFSCCLLPLKINRKSKIKKKTKEYLSIRPPSVWSIGGKGKATIELIANAYTYISMASSMANATGNI